MHTWGFSIFPTAWQTHFNPSKPQPPNALWQEGRQSYTGMPHPLYPWPGLISPNPCVSADLSWADVTEATELEQEVVAGKGHLCIGNAAVVTFRDQRGIDGNGFWAGEVTSTALNIDHTYMSFEAGRVQSPHSLESLPFLHKEDKKKNDRPPRSRHNLTREFRQCETLSDTISLKQTYSVDTYIIYSKITAKQRQNTTFLNVLI